MAYLALKNQLGDYFSDLINNPATPRVWVRWAGCLNILAQEEFETAGFLFSETEEKIKNFLRKRRELSGRRFRRVDDREALRLLKVFEAKEKSARGLYDHAP